MSTNLKVADGVPKSGTLEMRPFRIEQDLAGQRELFRDAFPETVGTPVESEGHYRWKFREFPDHQPSYEYVCLSDGRIVGYYAAIPYPYKLFGEEIRVGMVCDVMTHSSMRGKGIFTKLGAYALREMELAGVDLVFGYPVRPEVLPGHLKVGWKVSGDLPVYVRVRKINSIFREKKLDALIPLGNFAASLAGKVVKGPAASPSIRFERASILEFLSQNSIDHFLNSNRNDRASVLLKTHEFLRWRFSAPDTRYQVVYATEGNAVLSAAFTRVVDLKGIPTLAILDFVGAPNNVRMLFRELDAVADEANVDLIACMMTPKYASELKIASAGFLRSPHRFQLISRPLSERAKALESLSADSFHPMWVDSDDL